ncbi:MAG: hypothetical protein AB2L21_10290 [Anaerolineaceae bacterium]|jgi:hypothetical protein
MDNKITIIEGPTPTFEPIQDSFVQGSATAWTAGILEGPYLYNMAMTTLRTFNSQNLLERCLDAWKNKQTMFLEYKDRIGLKKQSPIIAARAMNVEEGELLLLWVRQDLQEDPDFLTDDEPDTI